MAQLYRIDEQTTTGWNILPEEYRHLTKQECTIKYNKLVVDGINPGDLRIVRDDL